MGLIAQAEWGYLYNGSLLLSAVDENGQYQVDTLEAGDVWYFPPGVAHTVQGQDDANEYLLVFDDGNFEAQGYVNSISFYRFFYMRSVLSLAELLL